MIFFRAKSRKTEKTLEKNGEFRRPLDQIIGIALEFLEFFFFLGHQQVRSARGVGLRKARGPFVGVGIF